MTVAPVRPDRSIRSVRRPVPAAEDPMGAAMAEWAVGRAAPLHLRTLSGRRHRHDLAPYFAPLTAPERWLLGLAAGLVLDLGCGPARHARFLQTRGLAAVGVDRSAGALAAASGLGLRRALQADVLTDRLPAGAGTLLLLDGNLGLAGTPGRAARFLARLAAAAAPGARLLVGGRPPAGRAWRTLVLRGEYRGVTGAWSAWLVPSLATVAALAARSGWRLELAMRDGTDYWASLGLDPGPATRWRR